MAKDRTDCIHIHLIVVIGETLIEAEVNGGIGDTDQIIMGLKENVLLVGSVVEITRHIMRGMVENIHHIIIIGIFHHIRDRNYPKNYRYNRDQYLFNRNSRKPWQ